MMYAYSVTTKRSVVVALVALAVVMSGQRADAQPGWVLSHQKISSTQGGGPLLGNGDVFGRVTSLGDLDGDGGPSVLALAVGAWRDDDGGFDRGAVWVLFLNNDGTVNSYQKISHTAGGGPPLDNSDRFGIRVASLGDLDGDGPSVLALAVGAYLDDDGGNARGAVWILFLNTDGTVNHHQKISSTVGGGPPLDNGDEFGIGVASLGDLNGDGVADLAVGAWRDDDGGTDRGAVWILFLNTDGTVKFHHKISSTSGDLPADALENGDGFGLSGGSLGDFDGEGPSVLALAVGAAGHDEAPLRGAVWVLFLNPDGTVNSHKKISDTEGGGPPLDDADAFGVSVGSLGDLDGDGVGDLAVGAFFDNDGGPDRGAVWILFLNPDGDKIVKSHQKISDTQGGFTGILDNGDLFGLVASLGDLNGDGVGDLAVGAQWDDDGGTDRGAVYILFLDGICSWDLDANGSVGILDLLALLAAWGPNPGHPADFDDDGAVGILDLLTLLANWGPCP
ncbi:MAG: FG-GAP repeat protein [Planctomycetes bacterium]|nr:FG-GAP repeat protein [Planctomycetota bacterium]